MKTAGMYCEKIAAQLGSMFVCSTVDQHVRIRTPFLYPDGDVIDVYLVEQNGKMALTDFGESLRWLRSQSSSMKKTPKQKMFVHDVCMTHRAELQNGMLLVRLESINALADAVIRLGQASARVADIVFTMRVRSTQSATDEVEEYLREKDVTYRRGENISGRSGRLWNIDFVVTANENVSLVQVLSTGSRVTAKNIVNQVVAMWVDINPTQRDLFQADKARRVSLFDDTSDVWEPSDFDLVASVGDDVVRWSKPDELDRLIHAAA